MSRAPSEMCQLLCPPYIQMGTVGHSQTHATITTKLFCFSSNVENRRVAFGSPPALGAGGLELKSARPDDDRTDRMPTWHGTINPAFKRGYQVRF